MCSAEVVSTIGVIEKDSDSSQSTMGFHGSIDKEALCELWETI